MMTLSVVQNQMGLQCHDGGGGGSTDSTTRNMMDQQARARMPSGFANDDSNQYDDDDDDNGLDDPALAGQVRSFGANHKHTAAPTPTNTGDDNDSDNVNVFEMTNPGEHDVLLGRGGGTNNHIGNVNFRNLVNQHKMRYLASSKIEKPKVARDVVRIWKQLDPPGRFFQKKEGSGTDGAPKDKAAVAAAIWIHVPDKKAREKASQCLRERTADVMPYLTQLQQQREQMREQGVSMISQHLAAAQNKDGTASSSGGTGTGGGSGSGRSGSGRSSGNMLVIGSGGMNHMLSGGGGGGGGMHPGMSYGGGGMMGGMGVMGGGGMMMGDMNSSGFMNTSPGQQMPVNRRVSMPAGRSPNTSVASMMKTTGTPSVAADRRMSMPAGGSGGAGRGSQIGGSSSTTGPGAPTTDVEQRVLQDAYSVMDRAGDPDPANVMYIEQLLQEERMMEREAMLAERHALMQERMMMQQERMMIQQQMQGGQMSPYGPGQPAGPMMNMMGHPGWSPMAGAGGGGMPQNYNEMMFQQQQMMMAAHEQQRAVVDSHRQMMMHQASGNVNMTPGSVRSNEHVQPNLSVNGNENVTADGALARPVNVDGRPAVVMIHDMEPIPYLEDGSQDGSEIPLSIIPDVAKSLTAAESAKKRSSASSSQVKSTAATNDDTKPAALAPLPAKVAYLDGFGDGNEETEVIPLKDPAPSSPRKLKSAFKRGNGSPRTKRAFKAPTTAATAAAAAVPHPPTDEAGLVEYRKTLENYMSAHKISAPTAVDNLIDDDLSDVEDIGVDASAWLQQTLNDSSEFSINNNKKKKRTKKDHCHHGGGHDEHARRPGPREPERGVARNRSNESLMSTEVRSLDGKSMDGMSLMSLAISEMEENERQQKEHKQRHPGEGGGGGDDSEMEEESVDFDGRGHKMNGARSTSSSRSVMSELTDFSDNGENDDDEEDVIL